MLLEYVELPYEQDIHTVENSATWFSETKPKLLPKNPAANLPYLLDGEKVVSESDAIMIYIAHRSGKPELVGRNAEEQVNLATTMGVVRDLHAKYITLVYARYGDKTFEQAKAEYLEQSKAYLNKLNLLIEGKDYYAGQITWIDFAISEFIQVLFILDAATIEAYPNVLNHQRRVYALPAIQNYHKTDRYHERPINSPVYAKFY